jgi:hypothetical protein
MTDLFEDNSGDQPISFDALVGEGKKYKSPDEVAKAVIEKDRFIEQLKAENATARQELQSRTNLEEVVNQLRSGQAPSQQPNREITHTPRQEPVVETPPVDLEATVANLLKAEREKDNKANNLETALSGLRERFGADYKSTLRSIVGELGVSEAFVQGLAETSPSGFLKLIDSVKAPDDRRPVAPPRSHDPVIPTGGSGRRNKAYYDDLRRTDINRYLSPSVQNQYHKDAMEQGESFYK